MREPEVKEPYRGVRRNEKSQGEEEANFLRHVDQLEMGHEGEGQNLE